MSDQITMVIPCYWVDQSFIDMTSRCLDGLDEKALEIIVVDDGSPMTWNPGEEWHLVINQENKGYAGAVNAGLEEATGDIIIISNNDIEFIQPDWLDHLIKPLKEGYDIASIRTTDTDGWETEDYIEDGAKFGSIWAMKRKVYKTIGGLDESYGKGYFEDLDYQKRAEDAGFRVGKNHAGIVEHYGKATFAVIDPTDDAYYTAMARFKKKWGKVW